MANAKVTDTIAATTPGFVLFRTSKPLYYARCRECGHETSRYASSMFAVDLMTVHRSTH